MSDDGLEWRFTLAPNIRFHSGDRCDARAVVAALEYLRWNLLPGQEHWYWRAVDRIVARDPTTIAVRLRFPYSRLPSLLWGTHSSIHNERARAAAPDEFGYTLADGTGPYRLSAWSAVRVRAERFPDYWQSTANNKQMVERIEWVTIPAAEDRLAALLDGAVDVATELSPSAVAHGLGAERWLAVAPAPCHSNVYLGLNWSKQRFLFDDPRVRQAMSLAIDRREIARRAYEGDACPTYGPLPPGDPFYDPDTDAAAAVDRARARLLLAACGWHGGEDELLDRDGVAFVFDCVCQDEPVIRKVSEAVRDDLHTIGVDMRVQFAPVFSEFYERIARGPDAFLSQWIWQDPMDAIIGFSSSRCVGGANYQHARVPDLDMAFDAWTRAGSDRELADAARRSQCTFARELPYVPLVSPDTIRGIDGSVEGLALRDPGLYPEYTHAHFNISARTRRQLTRSWKGRSRDHER